MKDLIKKVSESPAFVWFLRVLISALFFVSAVAKMYPSPEIGLIKYFEIKQLVCVPHNLYQFNSCEETYASY